MEIKDLMKELALAGVSTSMHYSTEKDQFFIDLETKAKSSLTLYEDGLLCGRYQYTRQLDLSEDIDFLITQLCYEFVHCLHGRNFYNLDWGVLCEKKGINLNLSS